MYFEKADMEELLRRVDAQPGDFILFCADKLAAVRRILGTLRLDLGDLLGLRKKDEYKILFVTDFPEFEYSEEEGRWMAMHHPFTMPYPEDIPYLLSDPERVRAQAYDVVLNGVELGSGSIRIHRQDIQQKMLRPWASPTSRSPTGSASWWAPSSTALRPTAALPLAWTGWSCSCWGRIPSGTSSPSPR